jgi:xylulokinase
MEGIAFCIGNCFEAISTIARDRNESIKVIRTGESGGSRLPLWRQIITDALDFPVEVASVQEPGCLGAALLAGVGVGEYQDIQYAIDQTIRVASRTWPDPENSAVYKERRSVFNETYRALEPVLYQQAQAKEAG